MKKSIYILTLISLLVFSCSKENTTGGGTPTAKVPGKAALISPDNNKTCEEVNSTGQVSFSWNSSTDTDKYDLEFKNLNTQTITNYNNITTTSKLVTLSKGIPYSWTITSKNSGSKTTVSDTWQFYLAGVGVVNYAPFPATAISPSPGATTSPTDGKVNIQWNGTDADQDTLTFTIEMDLIDGKQETKIVENTSDSSFEVTVELNKIYYWRVITSDGENTSTSMVFSFRTPS